MFCLEHGFGSLCFPSLSLKLIAKFQTNLSSQLQCQAFMIFIKTFGAISFWKLSQLYPIKKTSLPKSLPQGMLPERKLKPNKPSMQCSLPLVMITFFQLVVINPIFTWNRCKYQKFIRNLNRWHSSLLWQCWRNQIFWKSLIGLNAS